jgi:hypothetical protein
MSTLRRTESTVPTRAPAVLVPLIRHEHERGMEHYRNVGALLLEAKPGLPHGQFQKWIHTNFDFSYNSATVYMRSTKIQRAGSLRDITRDSATRRQTHRPARAKALPTSHVPNQEKASVREMGRDLIDAGFRALAVKMHPDKSGGSVQKMTQLTRARDVLIELITDW